MCSFIDQQIPESAELHFGEDKSKGVKSRYPIISVKNVTIFPGVPHLLERAFALLGEVIFYDTLFLVILFIQFVAEHSLISSVYIIYGTLYSMQNTLHMYRDQ